MVYKKIPPLMKMKSAIHKTNRNCCSQIHSVFWGITFIVCLSLVSIGPPFCAHAQGLLGKERTRAIKESIIGQWLVNLGSTQLNLQLTRDGRFLLNGKEGTYSIEGNILKMVEKSSEVGYSFDLAGGLLTLSGGDLNQPLKFSRKPEITGFLGKLFTFSLPSVKRKTQRILVIFAVMALSGLIIMLLRAVSHSIIYSDRGILRFIFTRHKSKILTLHSLILNVLKYIIYFTAFGFILSELGVNYKAYLASLSVIGLAIGFGSQGLVQDVVTGFFLIFEGQCEVGDLVEISGQTGIVEELGLRVTKLRNYFGQLIAIPNRNIAVVGNYTTGALQATIDVAVKEETDLGRCSDLLHAIGNEISRQFEGIFLEKPGVAAHLSLETGEHFVRIHAGIWPQQQWVIDQQMVPRIREIFRNKEIEIPGERIVIFYHAREEQPVSGWREYLKRS